MHRNPEDPHFPEFDASPDQEEILNLLDEINVRHEQVAQDSWTYFNRPMTKYWDGLMDSTEYWMDGIETLVDHLEQDGHGNAPQLLAGLCIEQAQKRAAALEEVIGLKDYFVVSQTDLNKLTISFMSSDDSDILDRKEVLDTFRGDMEHDFRIFGDFVTEETRPTGHDHLRTIAPKIGSTLVDVAKIAAGAWIALRIGK